MGRIFLSYAREDLAAAKAFAGVLEGAGHEVWWDHHLRAGSRFSWDIASALKAADCVLVLWSKQSIESAWVQDEAAEGLERSRLVPVALDGSKPPLGFRQYHTIDLGAWRAGGGAFDLLLAAIDATIAGTAAASMPAPPAPVGSPMAICVLPFANKSGDPEQDYFSEGITEDVLTDLSRISALTVIGQNMAAPGEGAGGLRQAASGLGATHLLEGSVRKSASRLRIGAQLIEAATGRTLWAERYDRELSDVFEIQDEISHAIVEALQLKLLPGETTAIAEGRTTSAEAYDLYLKARGLWPAGYAGDCRKNEQIVRLCTAAAGIDGNYANAWALAALAAGELRFWQGSQVDALDLAGRALALDPRMPEPHCVRALHFEEQGLDEEAAAAADAALRLDPDSWEANCTAGRLLFRRGDTQQAVQYLEKGAALSRKDHASASMLVTCLRATGDESGVHRAAELAVAAAEGLVICDPANGSAFASAARGFAALGECERARKWLRKALAVDPGNLAMRYSLAATAAGILDDESQAIEILDPFVEAARLPAHVKLLELDPSWAPIRRGAAFQAMLRRARRRVGALAPVSC